MTWRAWGTWAGAVVAGSCAGLALRLALFGLGALLVRLLAEVVAAALALSPSVDPVYTRAALRSLADLHFQGLAVACPPGEWLQSNWPRLFVDSALVNRS